MNVKDHDHNLLLDVFAHIPTRPVPQPIPTVQVRFIPNFNKPELDILALDVSAIKSTVKSLSLEERGGEVVLAEVESPNDVCV